VFAFHGARNPFPPTILPQTPWSSLELSRACPGVANADGQQAILNELIAPLEALCAQEAARFGYTFNIPVATRISVAMVLATALFKEWLFPQGQQASDEEIVDELLAILLHGIAHRSPA
jgi:hypothetical protein